MVDNQLIGNSNWFSLLASLDLFLATSNKALWYVFIDLPSITNLYVLQLQVIRLLSVVHITTGHVMLFVLLVSSGLLVSAAGCGYPAELWQIDGHIKMKLCTRSHCVKCCLMSPYSNGLEALI